MTEAIIDSHIMYGRPIWKLGYAVKRAALSGDRAQPVVESRALRAETADDYSRLASVLVPRPMNLDAVDFSPLRGTVTAALTIRVNLAKPHDVAQANRLIAAALYDLAGASWQDIADTFGYETENNWRVARKAVQLGRGYWAKLDTWPWKHFPNGKLSGRWLEVAEVVDGWIEWAGLGEPTPDYVANGEAFRIAGWHLKGDRVFPDLQPILS